MKSIKKADRPIPTDKIKVAKMDGAKTRTLKKFYRKISDRLEFPDYFGTNLDALADALMDLSWLKEKDVRLYIKNPNDFLSKEKKSTKNTILEILAEAVGNQIEEDRTFTVRGVMG